MVLEHYQLIVFMVRRRYFLRHIWFPDVLLSKKLPRKGSITRRGSLRIPSKKMPPVSASIDMRHDHINFGGSHINKRRRNRKFNQRRHRRNNWAIELLLVGMYIGNYRPVWLSTLQRSNLVAIVGMAIVRRAFPGNVNTQKL